MNARTTRRGFFRRLGAIASSAGLGGLVATLLSRAPAAKKTPPCRRCPSLRGCGLPDGVSAETIVEHLSTRYGITIAGGQDHVKEKVFRVSHMGYLDVLDMVTAVAAVEMTLKDLGCQVDLGAGVRAAQEILTSA